MFGLTDLWEFLWSVVIVYPLVLLTHSAGHCIMALLLGGRAQFALGRGKRLFHSGDITIYRLYFLDSSVRYAGLKWNNRFSHLLVHCGGVIFNIGSVLLLNGLIGSGILPDASFFYKFSYFSVWFAALSLIPVDYGDGSCSDGLTIYYVLKYKDFRQLSN